MRQQTAWNQLFVLIRTDGSPAALMPAARQAISSLDAEQPAYLIQTLDDATAASTFQQRIAALFAQRGDVLWLVLSQVLRLSAIGLALGIAILLLAGRLLERLLFEVRASDPLTISLVTLVLAAVAVVAAWARLPREQGRSDSGLEVRMRHPGTVQVDAGSCV